ncbi:hypothetical protein [Dyella sp. 2HG41-7]|uniref:hypothetical protein n=1 Tax=Dyella sp. 2HG41-7 TaxID=2883239 RepID=UPI001F2B703E|nr:hypothetical protein [Dyella sp. 2HG41-7]
MSIPVDSSGLHVLRARRVVMFAAIVTVALAVADLIFASTYWYATHSVPPMRLAQNIASGLLGKRAFMGGDATASLGVLLHFAIMAVMVGVYYLASRRMNALIERPLFYGALYGVALYVVMNGIVLPLSAAPASPSIPSWILASILMHMIIGLVIAWSASKARTF